MSLLDTTPPVKTIADYQADLVTVSKQRMNDGLESLIGTITSIFLDVWSNPNLTPQQALDAFGTDAASLFIFAGTMQQAINSIAPNMLTISAPNQVTVNPDGTVTVGDLISN